MSTSSHLARRALASALLMALAAPAALAQSASASSYNQPSARVLRSQPGQALGHTAQGGAVAAVAQALRSRGTDTATAASLVQLSSSRSKAGLTHVRMEQRVDGLTVYGSDIKASFDAQGRLVHVAQRLAAVSGSPKAAAISERQALDAALAHVHPDLKIALTPGARSGNTLAFKGGDFFHQDPQVTRVLVPQADGSLAQGFVVQTWTAKANQLHRTLVGGDGAVLDVELRTQKDSYAVFPVSPLVDSQTTVAGPGPGGNAQSPAGWLFAAPQTSWHINGNNVSAYLDTDANNAPDAGGTTVADGNFLTAANLSVSPTTAENKNVAVQNLFFLNNRVHDILYSHGFTEAVGNFQVDNFGKGGNGNDPVNAEAQDGGGTDNANFATPPDGSRPRMQMYLWTGAGATHEVVLSGNTFNAVPAAFGPQLDTTGLTGVLEAIADQGGVSATDGCEPFTMRIPGLIALLDRGTCDFTLKVAHAQRAGAIGVVVANNVDTPPITMGGSKLLHPRIPAVMVSKADGATLRTASGSTVTIRMKTVLPLQVDGDLDSDVVYHEYGHGLTWRMIGGMSGPMGGAVGEGASDVVAFMINGDDRIGEYSASTALGIRRAPYATYPLKYSGFTGEEVHNDGEIFAATLWRLRTAWLGAGRSNESLFDAFVGGMNFTPATPAFEDMRNGMLDYIASTGAADANAQCTLVWTAFAFMEVGDGANAVVKGKRVTITPSTVARANCTHD